MKQNMQKVIKCLTCLVTCFMILVCSVTSPARAAVSDADIFFLTDYTYEVVRNEDDTYVDFRIDHPDGNWLQCVNSSETFVDGTSMVYDILAGSSFTRMDFYYYYLGSDNNGSFEYNYLSLGSYNKYNTITIDCTFDFTMTYFDSSAGDIPIMWRSIVKYYDAEFNYLGYVDGVVETVLNGGGTSGDNLELMVHLDLPEGAAYIVPYQRLNFDFSNYTFTRDMTITVKRDECFQLGVLYETNMTDEEIEDNIASDRIDNATGEMDNAGNVIGGAVDDYLDINNKLPTVPGDFSNITPSDDLENTISDILKVFDWDKSGLNIMYGPLTLSLGLAVLFYVVFGKG